MLFRFPTLRVKPLTGALLAAGILTSPSLAAETGPFSGLGGAWSGSGVISSSDGRSERVRCHGQYSVSEGGSSLNLRLSCASDSYHFDANSGVALGSAGEITGNWSESGTNADGDRSGVVRATSGRLCVT